MHGIKAKYEYSAALNGFAAKLSKDEYASLQLDSNVAEVEGDAVVTGATDSLSPSWGLDRLDQLGERLDDPPDGKYNYVGTGAGVTAYVIDGGIRTDHVDFEGRAVAGKKGFDAVGDGQNGQDCFGHGTHVAGTIGGKTYGVAKKVKLVSVRVLGCDNHGTLSGLIAGVDWVVAHAAKPAVVNISIEAPILHSGSDLLSDVITNAINQNGLPFVVAAGNGSGDACTVTPAATPLAITVGASDPTDNVAAFSNYGSCVDLWAPGVDIISADNASATATLTRSGTSMATPHVAGLAALFLQRVPKRGTVARARRPRRNPAGTFRNAGTAESGSVGDQVDRQAGRPRIAEPRARDARGLRVPDTGRHNSHLYDRRGRHELRPQRYLRPSSSPRPSSHEYSNHEELE